MSCLEILRNENQDEEKAGIDNLDMGIRTEEFLEQIEQVRASIDSIANNVEEVEQKHLEILSSATSDSRNVEALEGIMANIKNIANEVTKKLNNIDQQIKTEESTRNSSSEVRIKRTQHTILSRKFVEVMNAYYKTQRVYLEKFKNTIKDQLEIVRRQVENEPLEELIEKRNPKIFTPEQGKETLAYIEEMLSDIMKRKARIYEVQDTFMDLAMLVESQGKMADRIEYNTVRAKEYVDRAVVDTKKAIRYQSRARRVKKYIIIVSVVVLFGVIALIIVTYFCTSSS